MPKSRTAEWIVVGLVLALVLGLGVAGAALRGPLTRAAGLDRAGGQPSIPADVFVEPTAPPTPEQPDNLLPAAALGGGGKAPTKESLSAKLSALDTSGLRTPDNTAADIAYEVIDVATGEVIVSRNAAQPLIPASNTKTLTIVSAFNVFEGNERFSTKVVQPEPGRIVLVGEGDALLTAEPVEPGTYPRPPSLRELAQATAKALKDAGTTSVKLGYDASYFEDPGWAATWPGNYRDQVTTLSALWADEGRVGGVRQQQPAAAAAHIFASQLGELGITVDGEPAAETGEGKQIAAVQSLPIHVLAEIAMQRSNNSYTEILGFHLAKKTGKPTTFAGSTEAIREQLTKLGIWQEGAHLDDASGLSRSNRFTAHMLASANHILATEPRLTGALDGLPVAGVTGSLRDRFNDDVSRPARGIARAKTGTLSFVSTLGGTTTTADGAVVAFAVMSNGQQSGWNAKVWEEHIVGIITGCGC